MSTDIKFPVKCRSGCTGAAWKRDSSRWNQIMHARIVAFDARSTRQINNLVLLTKKKKGKKRLYETARFTIEKNFITDPIHRFSFFSFFFLPHFVRFSSQRIEIHLIFDESLPRFPRNGDKFLCCLWNQLVYNSSFANLSINAVNLSWKERRKMKFETKVRSRREIGSNRTNGGGAGGRRLEFGVETRGSNKKGIHSPWIDPTCINRIGCTSKKLHARESIFPLEVLFFVAGGRFNEPVRPWTNDDASRNSAINLISTTLFFPSQKS